MILNSLLIILLYYLSDGVLVPCHCCLAFGLLSWGYLIFNNIIDLCRTTFMLSLWSCFDTICIVKSAI